MHVIILFNIFCTFFYEMFVNIFPTRFLSTTCINSLIYSVDNQFIVYTSGITNNNFNTIPNLTFI